MRSDADFATGERAGLLTTQSEDRKSDEDASEQSQGTVTGPLLIILATASFAGAHVFAKMVLDGGLSAQNLLACRGVLGYLCVTAPAQFSTPCESGWGRAEDNAVVRALDWLERWLEMATHVERRVWLRSLVGVTTELLLLASYSLVGLTLADTFAIFMATNTISALVLSALCLREPPGVAQVCGSAASMVGIALITSPTFLFGHSGGAAARPTVLGMAVATTAGVFNGYFIVLARTLRTTSAAMLLANYMCVMAVLAFTLSLVAEAVYGPPASSASSLLWLIPHVLTSLFGHFLFARGCKTERVSIVVLLGNLELVFAYLFDWSILHEPMSRSLLLGGVATIAGSMIGQARCCSRSR